MRSDNADNPLKRHHRNVSRTVRTHRPIVIALLTAVKQILWIVAALRAIRKNRDADDLQRDILG
jgi:hypothetical protein